MRRGFVVLGLLTRTGSCNLRVCLSLFLQSVSQRREAIYPGYYTGRATHVHTKVFPEWSVVPPHTAPLDSSYATFNSGRLAHVGQFFFNEELNMVVDKMYPYVTNPIKDTIGRTRNDKDSLNIFWDSQGPEGKYNPVFKTHLVGGVVQQGLVAYITMGVNASASYDNFWKG